MNIKKLLTVGVLVCCSFAIFLGAAPSKAVFAADVNLAGKSAYLMDYNSGEVLFSKNENDKLPVASIVKLMTILLTLENLDSGKLNLEDVVVASHNAAGMGGSQVFIDEGGSYTIGDMLKSAIVSSANDASVVLAETIAGSESAFVDLMNKRAEELGLSGTHYTNCTGLPAANQFSTAKDVAKLLKEVTKHDTYHKYSTIWIDKLMHKEGRESELVNTNKLIRYFNGCDGGKTGSTTEAGYCLAATAKRGDLRLVGVVLGAANGKDRFAQTSDLLNYGFANFTNKKVVNSADEITNEIKVLSGKAKSVKVASREDIYLLTKKGEDKGYTVKTEMPGSIKAPVKQGDTAGKIYVIKNDIVVAEQDIVCLTDINKATIADNIMNAIENWSIAR